MLDCKDVSHQTSNYIDGELSLILRLRLKWHYFICESCRNYLQQIRNTIFTVSVLQPKENDPTDTMALAKKLHEQSKN